MLQEFTVIDLGAGLGGRSLVLHNKGFQVAAAVEQDPRKRNAFQYSFPDIPLLTEQDIDSLPPADVVTGRLDAVLPSAARKEAASAPPLVPAVLSRIMPKAFLLQIPSIVLKQNPKALLPQQILDRYLISYRVCDGASYSGLPVKSVQAYFVGLHRDLASSPFEFPYETHKSWENRPYLEPAEQVDPWYRKLPNRFYLAPQAERYPFFYRNAYGLVTESDFLHLGRPQECYLRDQVGIRRLTLGELSLLRGFPESWWSVFTKWPNRFQMYRILQSAPDLHIFQAIAGQLHWALRMAEAQEQIIEIPAPPLEPTPVYVEVKKEPAPRKKPRAEAGTSILQPRIVIRNLHIDSLKGLRDVDIPFQGPLTAIMGVNGSGKSTVLHALACMFSPPEETGRVHGLQIAENYKFPFFFPPTPDASWQGSSCRLTYFDENVQQEFTRPYSKAGDRWSPRYANRPKRPVYYLGIVTGLPEIEWAHRTTFIDYSTKRSDDSLSKRIITAAAEILQKDYQHLTSHQMQNKQLIGVHTASGITYSSLSMGAGEQRLIKILTTIYQAEPYSLILIDEIDLLLHCDARMRLIRRLFGIARSKHLQIVFTTHSLEIGELTEYTDIRYLHHTREKTLVYDRITPDIIYELSHRLDKPLAIYVEDDVAQAAVEHVVSALGMSRYVGIRNIGSVENAFTLAAGFVLNGDSLENRLIVLDGDKYRTEEEKRQQIKRRLTGTEEDHEERVNRALSVIRQFTLPEGVPPEEKIHSFLTEMDSTHELSVCAKEIRSVVNSHEWLDKIIHRLGQDRKITLHDIMARASESSGWGPYVEELYDWLSGKRREDGCI